MTRIQFQKQYFPNAFVVEITNKKRANGYFRSRTSCCWGNGIVKDTGWAVLAQPSAQSKGDKRTVFVCKESLIIK